MKTIIIAVQHRDGLKSDYLRHFWWPIKVDINLKTECFTFDDVRYALESKLTKHYGFGLEDFLKVGCTHKLKKASFDAKN